MPRRPELNTPRPNSEQSYLELLEALPLIVYCVAPTAPFTPLYVSRGIEALGFTREEWLENPESWVTQLHPDDRDRILSITSAALASGQPLEYEYRILARDGSVRWFHDRGSFVYDHSGVPVVWRGVMIDQTARHIAEQGLRRSESQWRSVFSHAPVGAVLVDHDGLFLEANQRFIDFIGYSLAELRAIHADELSSAEEAGITWNAVRELQEGTRSTVDLERRFIRKDGSVRIGTLTLSLIETHEGRGIVGMIQDITERRVTEEALRKSEEQLLQAQRMDMIGRLAGGIAHDFNNLLTVISSHADFAIGAVEDQAVRTDLVAIQEAADRAANLTRQLLAFGRRQVLQPSLLDINGVVRSTTTMLRRVLPESVILTLVLGDDLPSISTDGAQLEQVLINLILNACDAMADGGSLVVRSGLIRTETLVDAVGDEVPGNLYVRLSVEDTGHGMDAATRRRAFEPFFTTKTLTAGTGLGLSTVLGIVKQSGGFLLLESDSGKGTSVQVHLPVSEMEVQARSATAAPSIGTPRGHGVVVLVEDEAAVRNAVGRMLQLQGYEVHEATNGIEGVALVGFLEGRVDLVVSDVVMPAMGGVELASRLTESHPDIPILLISGYSGDTIEARTLAHGQYAFLAKPFSLAALAERAHELIRRRASTSALT